MRCARRAGGIKRSRPAKVLPQGTPEIVVEDSSDVSTLITASINQLRRGELDPRVANGIGYLATVLLRSLEQGQMEQRVSEMELLLGIPQNLPLRSDSESQAAEDKHGDA